MNEEREILLRNINQLLKFASLRDLKFVFAYLAADTGGKLNEKDT